MITLYTLNCENIFILELELAHIRTKQRDIIIMTKVKYDDET